MNLFGWMLFAKVFGEHREYRAPIVIPHHEPEILVRADGSVIMPKHKPLRLRDMKPGMIWEFE